MKSTFSSAFIMCKLWKPWITTLQRTSECAISWSAGSSFILLAKLVKPATTMMSAVVCYWPHATVTQLPNRHRWRRKRQVETKAVLPSSPQQTSGIMGTEIMDNNDREMKEINWNWSTEAAGERATEGFVSSEVDHVCSCFSKLSGSVPAWWIETKDIRIWDRKREKEISKGGWEDRRWKSSFFPFFPIEKWES